MADDPAVDNRDPASHPKILQNENPAFLGSLFFNGQVFLQQYGWFLVLGVLLLLYLKSRFKSQVKRVSEKVAQMKKNDSYDPDLIRQRQESMEESRRKMQERLDVQAAKHKEEQEKREEEKRKQKIKDWDNHQQGKGYRSKYRPTEESSSSSQDGASKPKSKNVYRNQEFNPLMGGGSMSGFRPARRSGGNTRGGG